ncbi:helix-turn-helix domain-containing protein [Sediminicoccus sp. KRV36]|uniref:IclR family transcriptional regulator n=1 Tax=Sediminicoccus sp. KRV36 TaxID=3133721 RepID=UPI00200E29F7|nr:helix-turn-helix domain-containing protein [Sediminicoccus rosea]
MERSLAILDAFLGPLQSRGLSELARATQLPKPTVLRSLVSLERMGYVVRLADGRYQLGARLLQLGEAYRAHFRLEDHVLPVLRHLATVTGESAAFQVREQEKRLTLFRVESPQSVRDVQGLPALLPLDGTSVSQALLRADWAAELARGRPAVFYTAGKLNPQTASLSTAVYGVGGLLRGALNISGPIERVSAADLSALAHHIAVAAARLSTGLGAPMPERQPAPELIRP